MPTNMKMYILVLDDVPTGFAMNSVAHASLACYLEYKDLPSMQKWLKESFKKVTCKVSKDQFDKAYGLANNKTMITESALDGRVVAVALAPQEEWDPFFKTLSLWR